MGNAALIGIPAAGNGGDMAVWRIVDAAQPQLWPRRRVWPLQLGLFGLGLLATAGTAGAAWTLSRPDTIVQTRILADASTEPAARAALSDVALRLAASPDRPVMLQEGGTALVVTTRDRDPAEAQRRSRSLVDAILNAPVAALAMQVPAPPPPSADGDLRADRARLVAAAAAVEAQAGAVSISLANLARDAAARSAADRKPSRDTLDKGNAALADLQLQRLQLVAKYQDTYPAVIALDGQIRNLHVFLSDEAHRVDARPAADPADALLSGERDRLRTELSQLDDRRHVLAAQLAAVDDKLSVLPADPQTAPAAAMMLPPMLVATATNSFEGEDGRLVTVPTLAAIGLMLSALLALLPGRRTQGLPRGLRLEPMRGMMVAGGDSPRLAAPRLAIVPPDRFPRPAQRSRWG